MKGQRNKTKGRNEKQDWKQLEEFYTRQRDAFYNTHPPEEIEAWPL